MAARLRYAADGSLSGWRLYFPDGTGEEGAALPGVTVTLTGNGGAETSLGDFVVIKQWD